MVRIKAQKIRFKYRLGQSQEQGQQKSFKSFQWACEDVDLGQPNL